MQDLDAKIQKLEQKLKLTKDTSEKEIWKNEIDEFVKQYTKMN